MLINESSIIGTVFVNYITNVFGNPLFASMVFIALIMIIALMIKIPLVLTIGLTLPIVIILMVMNYIPVLMGGLLIIIMMVIASLSFINGFGPN